MVGLRLGGGLSADAGATISVGEQKTPEIKEGQWGIKAIGFTPQTDPESAWNLVDAHKKNITIAIIDSGLDITHKDSPQYIWENTDGIPNNGKETIITDTLMISMDRTSLQKTTTLF